MVQFFETNLGQRFVNTVIKHTKGVDDNSKRIADSLEKIATVLETLAAGQNETKEILDNLNETLKYLK